VAEALLLSPEEIAGLTGKHRSDAQMRALKRMGIAFKQRPDGSVAVLRRHVEAEMGCGSTMPILREPELRL
jgi:hypothetical protein